MWDVIRCRFQIHVAQIITYVQRWTVLPRKNQLALFSKHNYKVINSTSTVENYNMFESNKHI